MGLHQKQPRVRLKPEDYGVLRNHVLKRDGWRCQDCGAMKDLQVHHIKSRSQLGGDVAQNLITLCASCHGKRHGR
jgi:5-methylcytosine-specific restriction endonuclease McrA